MKTLLLILFAFVVSNAQISGKLFLKGNNAATSSLQVCYQGTCETPATDGTYSFSSVSSISKKASSASTFYKIGNFLVSSYGKRITVYNIRGQVLSSGIGSLNISGLLNIACYATDGSSVLSLNGVSSGNAYVQTHKVSGVAARSTGESNLVYFVVDSDTLYSEQAQTVIPTGYLVQRNVRITNPKYASDSTEIVYFDSDSIAHIKKISSTGFLYNYYDSLSFVQDNKEFSYFCRVYHNDSLTAFSIVKNTELKSDSFLIDSVNLYSEHKIVGYEYVESFGKVASSYDTTIVHGQWISLDSLRKTFDKDTLKVNLWAGDTSYWKSVIENADSIKYTYNHQNISDIPIHLYVAGDSVSNYINFNYALTGTVIFYKFDTIVNNKVYTYTKSKTVLFGNSETDSNITVTDSSVTYSVSSLHSDSSLTTTPIIQLNSLTEGLYKLNPKVCIHVK